MKNLIFLVGTIFLLVAMSCEKERLLSQSSEKDWQKIDLQAGYIGDLKKIISLDDEVIVFSQAACWASKDLKHWEERAIPD